MVDAEIQLRRAESFLSIARIRATARGMCKPPTDLLASFPQSRLNRFLVLSGQKYGSYELHGGLYSFELFQEVRECLEHEFFELGDSDSRWARVYDLDSHGDPVDFSIVQEVRIPR